MKRPKDFYEHCVPPRYSDDNDVDSVGDYESREEVKQLINDYFISRGLPKPKKIEEPGVFSFKSVSLHVDGFFKTQGKTIILPIKGRGELGHLDHKWDIIESQFKSRRDKWSPLFLDDQKPHCFIAKGRCYAAIAYIDKKSWEAAKNV